MYGCQQAEEVAEEHAVDVEADIEAIRNWVNKSYATGESGDLEGYLNFWAEDVIWMPRNSPTLQGIGAVKEYLQPYFEKLTLHIVISIEEIRIIDDFSFARINTEEKYTPKTGGGETIDLDLKIIFLLQRMPDGTWLGTHCIWNSNDPLPTSDENK
jgi:uncharacterized protein (TIGR02246 family)